MRGYLDKVLRALRCCISVCQDSSRPKDETETLLEQSPQLYSWGLSGDGGNALKKKHQTSELSKA